MGETERAASGAFHANVIFPASLVWLRPHHFISGDMACR